MESGVSGEEEELLMRKMWWWPPQKHTTDVMIEGLRWWGGVLHAHTWTSTQVTQRAARGSPRPVATKGWSRGYSESRAIVCRSRRREWTRSAG